MFTGDDIALPVLRIECLHDARCARGLAREGGDEEKPVVGNRAVALQHLGLSRDIPAVVGRAAALGIVLVRDALYLKSRAILHDEVEGSVYLAGGREAIEDVADKVFGEHADIGVGFGKITKRPAVKAEDVQQFP